MNILWEDDTDQSPVPLQQPKLETEAMLGRQCSRTHHFEPPQAVLAIVKNLPNGTDRVRCYSDRARRWAIWRDGCRGPTSRDELGECLGRDKFLRNWIGNTQGAPSYVTCKRASLTESESRG